MMSGIIIYFEAFNFYGSCLLCFNTAINTEIKGDVNATAILDFATDHCLEVSKKRNNEVEYVLIKSMTIIN